MHDLMRRVTLGSSPSGQGAIRGRLTMLDHTTHVTPHVRKRKCLTCLSGISTTLRRQTRGFATCLSRVRRRHNQGRKARRLVGVGGTRRGVTVRSLIVKAKKHRLCGRTGRHVCPTVKRICIRPSGHFKHTTFCDRRGG